MNGYPDIDGEELRFLHRRMRLNQIRERNKRRATAAVLVGLILVTLAAIAMAVR